MNTEIVAKHIQHTGEAQRTFLIYVRTLQFMKLRLKDTDDDDAVHISLKEIEERFFKYPEHLAKLELKKLEESGDLEITEKVSPKSDRRMFMYKALRAGAMDLHLVTTKVSSYGINTMLMKGHLNRVTLHSDASSTVYFDAFLTFRDELLDLFFTVDDFSGRVHTPVTSLNRTHRSMLLIDGCPTIGLDVTTMQPLILGKILKHRIGKNLFSEWIDAGQDIYNMLQEAASLETRDEGKKRFFEILFAHPSAKLAEMFGEAEWITWVNEYKKALEPDNPHSIHKPHSNLAWLLQTTEVKIMRKVWQNINEAEMPFLSVHDEIIVKLEDKLQAESIFRQVLDKEFSFYKLDGKASLIDAQPLL